MRQLTELGLLTVAGCMIAATAACTPATTPAASPSTAAPSATAGTGSSEGPAPESAEPAATEPAATKPAATEPAPETTSPATGQDGQGDDPDWAEVAYRVLGCKHQSGVPKRAEVQHTDRADLTGDGRRDTIVAASCPTTTSTNAVHVFVFGRDDRKPLLDVGRKEYLRTAEVTTGALSLTLNSEAISEQGALCCPDLRIRQRWEWTGSAFVRTAFSSRKL